MALSRRRRVLAAATGVAVAATGLGIWLQSGNVGSEAACPALLQLDGRSYDGVGGVVRTPRPGAVVGEAVMPGCDDGNGPADSETTQAHAIPGIEPELAVLAGGRMWEAVETPTSAADSMREFLTPVHCRGPEEQTLSGTMTGNNAGPVEEDFHVTAPYVATFRAGAGSGLPLDRYSSVLIRIRVTTETIGGEDPDLLRHALGEGEQVQATVRCDGRRFRAVALALS